jgi:hypothetical protein
MVVQSSTWDQLPEIRDMLTGRPIYTRVRSDQHSQGLGFVFQPKDVIDNTELEKQKSSVV